ARGGRRGGPRLRRRRAGDVPAGAGGGGRPSGRGATRGDAAPAGLGAARPPAPARRGAPTPRGRPTPGILDLPEIGQRLVARVVPRAPEYAVPREPSRAAFDADALPAML